MPPPAAPVSIDMPAASVSVVADWNVTSSSVVVMSAPVEVVPPPSSLNEPSSVKFASLCIERRPLCVMSTVPPFAVVTWTPSNVTFVPVRSMPTPPAALSVTSPRNVVVPSPASCVTESASSVESKSTLFAETIVMSPRLTLEPTADWKSMSPAPVEIERSSAKSAEPSTVPMKVTLPPPEVAIALEAPRVVVPL